MRDWWPVDSGLVQRAVQDLVFGTVTSWRDSLHEAPELWSDGLGLLGHGLPTSHDDPRACGIERQEWRDSQLA